MQLRRRPYLFDGIVLKIQNPNLIFVAHGYEQFMRLWIEHQSLQSSRVHANAAHHLLLIYGNQTDIREASICRAAPVAHIKDTRLRVIDTGVGPWLQCDTFEQMKIGSI